MTEQQVQFCRARDRLVQAVISCGFPAELGELCARQIGSPKGILVRHMLDSVKKGVHVLHNDETHIKVIRIKTKEGKVKKCHMWVVRSGKFEERQIVVYVFRKSPEGRRSQ